MERILERHDDVGTVGFMLYAGQHLGEANSDWSDFYAIYSDKERTRYLTAEEAAIAFEKGCIIREDYGDGQYILLRPTYLNYVPGAEGEYSHAEIYCCHCDNCSYYYLAFDPDEYSAYKERQESDI